MKTGEIEDQESKLTRSVEPARIRPQRGWVWIAAAVVATAWLSGGAGFLFGTWRGQAQDRPARCCCRAREVHVIPETGETWLRFPPTTTWYNASVL